ncbi:MAG: hypothetical protein R3E45_03190 [Rhodocyclaceae bacterium]|nr:hypothetical protein [Zoogloeaceae bacterium]MCP5241478.1 hypothetical protein [Zoogloeaceae bacterium]MCP5252941.1 hypothetical protein [Zoogloeaceae bacterium]MCP5293207.1 hypothetical protein [Zoogloeaceae bacterium]
MQLDERFSNSELMKILDEATVYQCACPAQVAQSILQLRELFKYQDICRTGRGDDLGVHVRIMSSVDRAHQELEACLFDVLELEGWDLEELEMPPGLRELRMQELLDD